MKRRSFIKKSSLLSVPGFIGGIPVAGVASSSLSSYIEQYDDRVLVLIQLNGGNDGLATIIPKDQQDNLANARPNIYIPENQFLDISDTAALHPSMIGIKELYDNAKVNIIQGVAYPDQNRSHFRSLDIWNTGSHADEFLATGWAGRYFDNRNPGYPNGYPTSDEPHPFALTIGSIVSETCQGQAGNFSLAIVNPENLNQLNSPVNNEVVGGCAGSNLSFLTTAIEQTNVYSEVITEVYDQGNNASSTYDDENGLAQKLKIVARLIAGGMQSKIYVVSLGGFDTHANQTEEGESVTGTHAELLSTLSSAIASFQEDIEQLGLKERVLGMTYSEFGRRIKSNSSFGTDHGTAAPLILFGSCVDAGIKGTNPEISSDVGQGEGVAMQFDFRSVYGSTLMDWFGVPEEEVRTIFTHDFQYISIANGCNNISSIDDSYTGEVFELNVSPNPTQSAFRLEFVSEREHIKISAFNAIGTEVKVLCNKTLAAGPHSMDFDLAGLSAGAYFLRLQSRDNQKTVRLIKQ